MNRTDPAGLGDEARIRQLRFLVVEDHEFQRNMLVKMLTALHVKAVHAAPDGRAGLEVLDRLDAPVDIIISDLDMPSMDGMEFMRHVGTKWRRTSLIVASGLDRELLSAVEAMAAAYSIQFLGTIEKPITPGKLEEAIRRHARPPVPADAPAQSPTSFTAEEIALGIRNDEFEPFFQPQVDVGTGRLAGAEALARWRHPQLGIISPSAFIDALEDSGRVDMLMRCILRKAAATCRLAQAGGHSCTVSVNVSLTSLDDVTLADQITAIVTSENVATRHMVLEITESATATDIGKSLENLNRLRMKGFGLGIDDYGTGYSSLEQLTRIPFTQLKIDQSFVMHASRRESARVILASSLEMARRLGITAIAEGVETRENWDMLCELECQLAQGYYIAKPMPAAVFMSWIADWPHMGAH